MTEASAVTVRDATARKTTPQCVRFAFYKVRPEWRERDSLQRVADREELAALIDEMSKRDGVVLRPYSLVGTRGDSDFMLWMISENVEDFQWFSVRLNKTKMAPFIDSPYHYLAMTKRSTYVENHEHEGQEGRSSRMMIKPGNRKYLFVYPFVKTRAWYRLPFEERQRMMDVHIAMGHKYPSIKINTTYSFGLDDQEFVVAFEGDSMADFVDLVHEMRESEASTYTVRDTPSFTCVAATPEEMLAAIG